VAMTYNDPVVFFEYAVDVAEACHKREASEHGGPRKSHKENSHKDPKDHKEKMRAARR